MRPAFVVVFEKFNLWNYNLRRHFPDRAMSEDQDMTALCPKCGEQLTYVTSVPHPKSPAMQRTTFVCYPCNRTWSYALAPAMADAYAASAAPAAGVG
jgi:hypothetical protein